MVCTPYLVIGTAVHEVTLGDRAGPEDTGCLQADTD